MTTTNNSIGSPHSINAKLDQLEGAIGSLGIGTDEHALQILLGMDEIQSRLRAAEASGSQLESEWVQWDFIGQLVKKNASLLLNKIGGPAGLMKKRIEMQVEEAGWWWFLDDYLAARRKANMRKILLGIAGAALLVALLIFAYQRFLAPPPEVTESYYHRTLAESAMQAGDLQTALAEIDLALGYLPENVELLTIKSILMESTGQADQAAEILDKARQLAPDSLNILLAQAQTYVLLQDPDGIRATGETLISRYPESAYGPMFVGSADELEGNYDAAVSQLNTAVELAESAGDINLSGNLRVRIGMLMQKSLAPELPQPTPAP